LEGKVGATASRTHMIGRSINTFADAITKIASNETVGGRKNIRRKGQRLWQIERGTTGSNRKTYAWVKNNVIPSEEYRDQSKAERPARSLTKTQSSDVLIIETLHSLYVRADADYRIDSNAD